MTKNLLKKAGHFQSEMSAGAGVSFFEMLCANGG
jgi:hypothetical protein